MRFGAIERQEPPDQRLAKRAGAPVTRIDLFCEHDLLDNPVHCLNHSSYFSKRNQFISKLLRYVVSLIPEPIIDQVEIELSRLGRPRKSRLKSRSECPL